MRKWPPEVKAEIARVGGERLLGQFRDYLISRGAGPAHVSPVAHAKCWRIAITGNRARRAIPHLYDGASIALARKVVAADFISRLHIRSPQS